MYGKLMNEALKSIIENKNALFKALLIPTLVLVGIDIFLPSSFLSNGEKINFEDNKFIFISFIILSIILNIVMAVSVHRIILIKDDISSLEAIMPTQTLLKFFLKSLDWTFNWIDFWDTNCYFSFNKYSNRAVYSK
jgi:hypothetical protein